MKHIDRPTIRRYAPLLALRAVIGAAVSLLLGGIGTAHALPSFGPPAPLNTTAADPLGSTDWPGQFVSDGAGTWIAVWRAHGSDGERTVTARSTDGGLSWSAPTVHVAHRSLNNPRVATDGAGTWVLVGQGGEVIRSTDDGVTWSDPIPHPVRVSADAGDTTIATNGLGTWIAGISRDFPRRAGIARSVDAGLTWQPPLFLEPNPPNVGALATAPQVVPLGGTTWLAVWSFRETIDSDFDVFHARSTDDGVTWTAPAPLSSTALTDGVADYDSGAQATTDGNGNVVVVWVSTLDLGGIGTDQDILVVRSSDNGASWSAAEPLNANAASDTDEDIGPVVATDGLGTWLAIWWHYGNGTETVDIAESTDAGATWSAATTLYTNAKGAWAPFIAHGAHQWLGAWMTSDPQGVLRDGPHLLVSLADHPCGNGIVDGGETCDDGNRMPADCCASTCTFEPLKSRCARDADVCTFDRCNATGTCEHVLEPRLDCRPPSAAGKSTLQLKAGGKPSLQWKTVGAEQELWDFDGFTFYVEGLPVVPDIAMCVYDSTGLVARATPHGSTLCGSQSCWTTGGAIRYADRAATADGLERISIQRAPKPKAQLKGRGPALPLPSLPIANLPLTVQLGTADDGCWSATYSSPSKNSGAQFKAKSD